MISIKGLKQGLLIVFEGESEPWVGHLRKLEEKLNASPGFFKGGYVALDVKAQTLSLDELNRTADLLVAHDVKLLALLTENESTRRNSLALGIPDSLPKPVVRAAPPPAPASGETVSDDEDTPTDGALIKRRIRSGQIIRHPGHVVVIGDVNPGAQIIAGGDIIVWGRLQGTAHAGAFGNIDATVCALEMSPSLIRIADAVVRDHKGMMEVAQIRNQEIIFSKWDNKGN
jgi:septum site-determining protein MinC